KEGGRTATSCPRRASAAASTASWRWLPPTARSRMKNKTFIPTTKRTSSSNRKGNRSRKTCYFGTVLAGSAAADLWSLFVTVEEARSAVRRVRHFAGFLDVMGRACQPPACGLWRQYSRRPPSHSRAARPLCRAEHRLYLGDGRASVFRDQHGDARRTCLAQAAL